MDLMIATSSGIELGIIKKYYKFDCICSNDAEERKNNWQLAMPKSEWVAWYKKGARKGSLIYINQTEYGGQIEKIRVRGSEAYLEGMTWEGRMLRMMAPRSGATISPTVQWTMEGEVPTGEVTMFGMARYCIQELINEDAYLLSNRYITDAQDVAVYTIYRYENAFEVLRNLFGASTIYALRNQCIFDVKSTEGRPAAMCRAVPHNDYSNDIKIDAFLGPMLEIEQDNMNVYNSIFIAGSGQGADRKTLQLWRTTEGGYSKLINNSTNIRDGRTYIYDYNILDNEDEMIRAGTKKLNELVEKTSVSIDVPASRLSLELCDVITARDVELGIEATATIETKNLRMTPKTTMMEYQAKTHFQPEYVLIANG